MAVLDEGDGEAAAFSVEGAIEKRIAKLRLLPMAKFGAEDLLLLARYRVGLGFVVPLAFEKLAEEPFLQAAEFPGDLLTAVLEVPESFWRARLALWEAGTSVLEVAMERVEEEREVDMPLTALVGDGLAAAILYFTGIHGQGKDD